MIATRAAITILLSITLHACTSTGEENLNPTTIVDLSMEFELGDLNNPGAIAIEESAVSYPNIRTALVLEHGKVVANYVRDDVDPDDPHQIWSATKSWMSLLIGLLVDRGMISMQDTFGDIFPNNSSAWSDMDNVTDVAFAKDITIEELLTMSSGLVDPKPNWEWFFDNWTLTDGGNAGGADLATSFSWPRIGAKGEYSYLACSTILSYVIAEVSGLSPREYLEQEVLPSLGIDESAFNWWQNEDGMEYAYHGLEMTAHQMAKFGQLYLQSGFSAPGKELVSSQWVEESTAPAVVNAKLEMVNPMLGIPELRTIAKGQYGCLFWVFNGTEFGYPNVTSFTCALGAYGQDICYHSGLNRVSVMQSDWLTESADPFGNLITTLGVAFDESITFTPTETKKDDDSSGVEEGGQFRLSAVTVYLMFLLVVFMQ